MIRAHKMLSFLSNSGLTSTLTSKMRQGHFMVLPVSKYKLYRVSLSLEAPNYCLCIQSNSAGISFRKYWQTGSFKACQMAFRMEFGVRRAPSKCCIQQLVKELETRGSRSNACRLLSLGPIVRAKCTKICAAQLNNSKTPYAKRFNPSTLTLCEKYSRIWKNAFTCAWM